MKVKVVFQHTLIPTETGFQVEAVVNHRHEMIISNNIESLEFIGTDGFNKGKKLFISVSGPEVAKIISIIYKKVNDGSWTPID